MPKYQKPNSLPPNMWGNPKEFDPAPVSSEWKSRNTFKVRNISKVLSSPGPVRLRTITNRNSFAADHRVLVMMANMIAQVHVILEEPLLPAHQIPGLIRDSWDNAVHTTGLNDVGLKLCGGADYMHFHCHPYKVAISNGVGNFGKMVKSNLPTDMYFDFATLDAKSTKHKVNQMLEHHAYIFETDVQVKRENPYLMQVIARCMFDHFFLNDGPSRAADPHLDLMLRMNPTMICLTAFLHWWNLQAWRTGKVVPLVQLNSDSRFFGDRKASAAALKVKLEEEKKKLKEELEESDYASLLTDID
ncbi:hypothetical protein BDD12DRAFT_891499 [Trichophaea hybrida]|nr:hypothetical protein BDD12DRAFT_891499 [Trichophaea hybrida]